MTSSSTITFEGTTYGVEVNGGTYASSGFIVLPGSAATGVFMEYNSQIQVDNGALSTHNTFSNLYARDNIQAGGISYQDTLSGFGSEAIISGTAIDLLDEKGTTTINSGGTLISGQIQYQALEIVLAGGMDSYSSINGLQGVFGTAIGDNVTGLLANQGIETGGVAISTTASNQGYILVGADGTAITPLIGTLGSATFLSGAILNGATLEKGGTIIAQAGSTLEGNITFDNGGTVQFDSGALLQQPIFIDGSGTFNISGITNITSSFTLDLTGTTLTTADTLVLGSSGTFIESGDTINFGTAAAGTTLYVQAQGSDLIVSDTGPAKCFAKGTRITTISGDGREIEVPVEKLKIGMTVKTGIHGSQKIKWIGKRAYKKEFIENNHLAQPITVRADAFGAGIPARNLTLSPTHALGFRIGPSEENDVLVQLRHLINGKTVIQEARDIEYYHVELPEHDVLFAEKCRAESFRNDGCRDQFQNVNDFHARYPGGDEKLGPAMQYPLLESGLILEAIKNVVRTRAGLPKLVEQEGAFRGYIDRRDGQTIGGWAQDADNPDVPTELLLMSGGQIVALTIANGFRGDLHKLGKEGSSDYAGKGYSAFTFDIPEKFVGTPLIVVRKLDFTPLPMSGEIKQACLKDGWPVPGEKDMPVRREPVPLSQANKLVA